MHRITVRLMPTDTCTVIPLTPSITLCGINCRKKHTMAVSASSVGRAFAFLGTALAGGAIGMVVERGGWFGVDKCHPSPVPYQQMTERTSPEVLHVQCPQPAYPKERCNEDGGETTPFVLRLTSKGLPSNDHLRYYKGFVSSLNYERRIPNWVLEYIPGTTTAADSVVTADNDLVNASAAEAQRDGMRFFADMTVPQLFRVQPGDYIGGGRGQDSRGLSRGHLAAAQFHKSSTVELAQTFNMNANTVPQDMTMNAVDWLRLENLTRKLRRYYERGLWVVTGPVFHPRLVDGDVRTWRWAEPSQCPSPVKPVSSGVLASGEHCHCGNDKAAVHLRKIVCYELVGKRDVAVPTHLFKVILGERADGAHEAAAFLMPNEPIAVERPLTAYQVPVVEIERLTGLEFFRNVAAAGSDARFWGRELDALPNICRRVVCEARTAGMFRSYRDVARLRAAGSLPELQSVYSILLAEQQQKCGNTAGITVALDGVVAQEYRERLRELMAVSTNDTG